MVEENNKTKYPWASNLSKLERAIIEVTDSGKDVKGKALEKAIEKVYRRLGGHVKGEPAFGFSPRGDAGVAEQLAAAKEEGRKEALAEAGIEDPKANDDEEEEKEEEEKEEEESEEGSDDEEENKDKD